jgi:hypothetical protein
MSPRRKPAKSSQEAIVAQVTSTAAWSASLDVADMVAAVARPPGDLLGADSLLENHRSPMNFIRSESDPKLNAKTQLQEFYVQPRRRQGCVPNSPEHP